MHDSNENKLVDTRLYDLETNVIQNTNRFDPIESQVSKLNQSYFTSGNGIVITDNRPGGFDTVDISVDTSILTSPRIDRLEEQINELQKTNKILAQYIYDDQLAKQIAESNAKSRLAKNTKSTKRISPVSTTINPNKLKK